MISFRRFFPLGKAQDAAFCNRVSETEQLIGNFEGSKHTLVIAQRRYGKSSLAEKAIKKVAWPSIKINFHLASSEEEVAHLIVNHVIKLIGLTMGPIEKNMASIQRYLSHLEASLSFGETVTLKLVEKKQTNYSVIIAEALLLIENLLKEKNKRAIIFFDEFQEIANLKECHAIEGAIRTAAQEMQQVSIIFSGSIRSLLVSMFEDENRPLYKLCRKIKLERIAESDYEKHIQNIAVKTWGKPLSDPAFQRIMELSHRHPYYVNYLCDSIWEDSKKLPDLAKVEVAWQKVVTEEWSDTLKELSQLPVTQRRLIRYIANNKAKQLQSHETCKQLAIPASSIASATQVLLEKDYIEYDNEEGYEIINLLLTAVLQGMED